MTTKMKSETKMLDFGKLEVGNKFYLAKPETVPETAYYTKITSQKDKDGKWFNAKSAFAIPTFVQYDKRVWITA